MALLDLVDRTRRQAAIRALLSPESCLVIGPSRDARSYSGRPLTFLETWGFGGRVGIVHPEARRVTAWAGFRSYASVEEAASDHSWDVALVLVPGPRAT